MLKEYLEALRQVKPLVPEEEQELWSRYKEEGDLEARRLLIEFYQSLVLKLVASRNYGLEEHFVLDLIQEGTVGLIEAVERFDHRRGVPFSAYARRWIRGYILDYLREVRGEPAPLSWEESSPAWAGELAVGGEGYTSEPQEQLERWELRRTLARLVHRLPEKEQAVVNGVYVAEQEPSRIASQLNITTSYLYRLQRRAIRRLRGMLARELPDLARV
ncbi:MAG: sigma-70 family RNA polymerase sigma factor [Bacillota bacterium]|nr:sigma-70 family RNA polymerase sigma factor [Bacillota bacterium]